MNGSMAGGKPGEVIADFQAGIDKLDFSPLTFNLGDLIVLDNQPIDGANHSIIGLDGNGNDVLDEG